MQILVLIDLAVSEKAGLTDGRMTDGQTPDDGRTSHDSSSAAQ